jgi:ribonucleotide monophosphatase NagD (HAD superfamily)
LHLHQSGQDLSGGNGQYFGPGRIAEIYEELGGQVRWIGKPFPAIYEHAIAQFPTATRDRTVCVGDSIEHDIAGGRAAGLQTILNTDGILKGKSVSELEELIVQHDARPDFILAGFKA